MNKLTLCEFIKKSNKKHNNIYDYSLVNYKNHRTKIRIICHDHGIFEQTPNSHLRGSGCPICFGKNKFTKEEFIKKSKQLYGDRYNYNLVNYNGIHKKVKIICKEHGEFQQTPSSHLQGRKCIYCAGKKIKTKDFIKKLKMVHGDRYDYSLVKYINAKSKIKIICQKHGIFEQISNEHLKGCGCPKCVQTKGEKEISKLLVDNNIKFEVQKRFHNCKNIRPLPFDFYLPDKNIAIEFDGIQHFQINEFFGGEKEFKNTSKKDKIKNNYCRENNIYLLRIKYNDNIFDILNKIIN